MSAREGVGRVFNRSQFNGFTLLEALVTVALLGILATLAGMAVFHGTARVRTNNAAFEVGALYAAAQMRATSMGVPHYVLFTDDGTELSVTLLERADSAGSFNWASDDVTSAATLGGVIQDRLRLSRDSHLGLLDLSVPRSGPSSLPAPFASIGLTPSGKGRLLAGCTFCTEGTGGTRGVIRFSPDGTVRLMTGGVETGGVIAFSPEASGAAAGAARWVVIAAPAGAVRVF